MQQSGVLARYQDKVCLVTASASGIGQAIAERFAKEGGIVLINSRKASNVNPVVEKFQKAGYKAHAYVGNMTKDDERQAIVKKIGEQFGRLDVLVLNHAQSLHFGSTLDTPEKAIDQMFKSNYKSYFMMVKECHELLAKVKGNILMNSSYTGYNPDKSLGVYSSLKSALLGLVKVFAKELQFDGIRVNGVAPGIIQTQFAGPLWQDENAAKTIREAMGVDRLGVPDDIAGPVSFICSDDAKYMTGETLIVQGAPGPRL